jgi:hypothetical protein
MNRLRGKLTYSNLISTLCLFLLVGGGTAFAASHLGPNSVGSKQLKKNAVTAAKLKAGAVTGAKLAPGSVDGSKIAPGAVGGPDLAAGAVDGSKLAPGSVGAPDLASGAVTGDKLAAGAVTGAKIDVGSLPTVPNSATTDAVKGSHGVLKLGQEATIFQYGPFAITAKCEYTEAKRLAVGKDRPNEVFLISSSTPRSAFASTYDGSEELGPETPEADRLVGQSELRLNEDSYQSQGPASVSVSASAAGGQAFNAFIGDASDLDSETCLYWLSANVIG